MKSIGLVCPVFFLGIIGEYISLIFGEVKARSLRWVGRIYRHPRLAAGAEPDPPATGCSAAGRLD